MACRVEELPSANDFAFKFSGKRFRIVPDVLQIDRKEFVTPVLHVDYDEDGKCRLHFVSDEGLEGAFAPCDSVTIRGAAAPVELLVSSSKFSGAGVEYEFITKFSPALMQIEGDCVQAEAVVVNAPETGRHNDRDFSFGDFSIQYEEFKGRRDIERAEQARRYGKIPVGKLQIKRCDGAAIQAEEAWNELHRVAQLFCLARGGLCGLAHGVGYRSDGSIAFAQLGMGQCDQFVVPSGWYTRDLAKELGGLYALFRTALGGADKETVQRALAFYRASNAVRDSDVRMAVIASYAGLETLVPHILLAKAGWAKKLIDNRDVNFHDKLRAAGQFVGISGAILLEHSDQLQKHARGRNNIDGYELLSLFRNKIVHADEKFTYQPIEMQDVWQLAQWLCELFLFSLIGYRGKMTDRRRRSGYSGHLIDVPLSR